ncbi:mechanosensitive ion channel family protein [Psychrobacter sp. M13]|uniref:mechanosensitive ion channel family protein n=1 Tax=Psychrobacter sp. M13 TaxID=3067275 RepID=UPI00273A7E25|nr:mechanosensitive ion channel family protein [Psychrobacter sp. M13]WLP95831.1 mechanosensitive ion channel family protein [Psychrobacter sp. M13]
MYLWLAILLLTTVLSLSPTSALAAEAGLLGIGSTNSEESVRTPIPDSFGRDTPRQTVQGFISALGENDYLLASNYLNLSKSDNPTIAVRQLKRALDTGGRFLPDLQLSNSPEGYLTDQLQPSQEKVGTINIDDKSVPIILERVVSEKGEQYWQFGTDTLTSIPEVLENTEPTLVSKYTFDSLEGTKLFGYQLTDLIAAILMTVSSFLLTYIAVWLLYHFLRIVYPYFRQEPLPLPDKIILPLSVVVMALMLSEIMVYAGISVTLREPINRFTEIASWLAITWLLLRIIDVLFTRAVNLSYKKNHTERVSILGLLRKVVKALLLIFAVIVIFGNLGFDLTTGIAALGVGGLALALGAQKTIENLVGSVVVVADSPVRIGDYCKFGTQEGTVIDIGIRSSRVRTLNRTVVTVPNGDFSSMQIENFNSRDMFHFLHNLYIKRSADIDVIFKMVNDLEKLLDEHELTNKEWNQAHILELRQDCYVIQLRAYVNALDVIEFYGKQDLLLVNILTQVKKYKVEHALPTQQLIVDQGELEHTSEKVDSSDDLPPEDDNNKSDVHSSIDNEHRLSSQSTNEKLSEKFSSVEHKNTKDDKQTDNVAKNKSGLSLNKFKKDKPKKSSGFRLAKHKFKHFKLSNKPKGKSNSLSIWNQPWH